MLSLITVFAMIPAEVEEEQEDQAGGWEACEAGQGATRGAGRG